MKSFVLFILSSVAACTVAYGATYEVPVSAELKPYAQFPMSPPRFQNSRGVATLTYVLPAELVGPNYRAIEMKSSDYSSAHFHLSSPEGSGVCTRDRSRTQCQIKMKDLKINSAEVEAFIRSISSDEKEVQTRLTIASGFAGDPVGILNY